MHETDVAVVGAGPAGVAAALAAARQGARVVLLDEQEAPGGHLRWSMALQRNLNGDPDTPRGYELAAWAAQALPAAGVETLYRAAAWGLFEDHVLGIAGAESAFQLRARSIVIASGATDVTLPFPGWELPGVLTATAALRMLHLYRVLPSRRVGVIGDGSLAREVAADLTACGAEVVAVGSLAGLVVAGEGRVEELRTRERREPVDGVVIALGRQPDPALALQAQVAVTFSVRDGAFIPVRNETLETSVPGIWVAGDAAGICTTLEAIAEGELAGTAAAGGDIGLALAALHRARSFTRAEPILDEPLPDDSTLVCRCEEVSASQLRQAIVGGALCLNDLKRGTRAGMGLCQGTYCVRTLALLLREEADVPTDMMAPMTARPPARLISLAALAELDA